MPFGISHGKGKGRGGRRFRRGKDISGISKKGRSENCLCPNCGIIVPHRAGLPCFQTKCPKCKSPMARQFLYDE